MADKGQLHYTQSLRIDRAHDRRSDDQWLESQRAHPDGEVILMKSGKFLISQNGEGYAISERMDSQPMEDLTLLGMDDGRPIYAAAIEREDRNGENWQDMRSLFSDLSMEQSSLLAYARAMLHWHRHHRFCGKCGGATSIMQGGFVRACQACGHQIHPRTDPAIIVLIYHVDDSGVERCLLAENVKRRGTGWFSTLAGFVEPGEPLESAVVREMKEESGLDVTDLEYIASQPWPFPSALMMGYFARSTGRQLTLEEEELSAARWFTREELRAAIDTGEVMPSREDSIARFLIKRWLDRED
ncbi:MAG: NAD(+) diphosphatase [Bacteroidota bacterium]